ncbi:hypothetical protein D1914_23415 [Salmonella enterica]|nr:hypothetical protein [Salmonella enterica]EBU7356983.1 hypothetical protein [Salmonella enterica subsp. enterica serovar Poona]EBL1739689.1 hypothetical protein [Salmonella enterica]ECA2558667.1 hypothetical protein [Salmonella enterica subsp. enterica serovar Poona]ECD3889100.1 hypothetical protein [Salmonella enterica subsp. enterica serovar Poona]
MKLAWDSFTNPSTEINWQYANARQSAVFSTTAYCPSKTLCPNARTEYIGFGDYRMYCKKSGNTCISLRHQVGAHSHAVSLGPNSHGNHLNPEYLSGVKNDV